VPSSLIGCTGLGGRARYLVRFQGVSQGTTYAH